MALKPRITTPGSRLRFEMLEPRLALSAGGLTGQYFHNADFTGLAETRTEAVSHNWGDGSPGAGIDADTFSVRWTGQVAPEHSELYTFRVLSDEGVRLWVDGQLLIDDWEPHVRRYRSGQIALEAGQLYDIRLDYYELSGPAQIDLSWSSASRPLETIPTARLHGSPAGLLGAYRDNTGGSLTRVDPTLDFDWGLGSPDPALDANRFDVEWTGQIRTGYSEAYTFSTLSDDGVRLWIGGELVIDNLSNLGANEGIGTKWLEAGKWHDIRVEYFENIGLAELQLRWSSPRQTGTEVFEIVPQEHLRATKPADATFTNPLGPGADPFVTQWDGSYLMTRSQGNAVWINRADSLQDIHASSAETTLAWNAPSGTHYSEQIWAPELHRLGANWYIYVAASDGNNATHRMHVLERTDPDPFGPYVYKGQITAPTDRWAIDGTVLQWNNVYYFVWSGWPGFSDGLQNLYIAEMRNPWTLRGDRVQIATPQYSWEMHGLALNEGPQILVHDGQLHIIYSGSGFWRPEYALGRLTYNGTGSLLDPASWTKAPQPVFSASSQVVGTGHASFVKSPDGTEDWIVYHAHAHPSVFQDDRVVSIQPFTFHADGTPNFGTPLPPGVPTPIPSAGPDPTRPYLPGDYNADGVVDQSDYETWRATFGAEVFPGTAADGSGNGTIDSSDYTLWRDRLGAAAIPLASSSATAMGEAFNLDTAEEPASQLAAGNYFESQRHLSTGTQPTPWAEFPRAVPHFKNPLLQAPLESARQRALEQAFAGWGEGLEERAEALARLVAKQGELQEPGVADSLSASGLLFDDCIDNEPTA